MNHHRTQILKKLKFSELVLVSTGNHEKIFKYILNNKKEIKERFGTEIRELIELMPDELRVENKEAIEEFINKD